MIVSSLRCYLRQATVCLPKVNRASKGVELLRDARAGIPSACIERGIRMSPRTNAAPLIVMLIKTGGIKVLKGLSIVFGRSFRKLYDKLPATVRSRVGKHRVIFSAGGILLPFVGYYTYTHYEECPITGRKRWITFTKEQLVALADLEYNQVVEQYQGKFLSPTHTLFQRNIEIVSTLISANSDIDTVNDMEWKLHVIDDPTVTNAFVLPNGHIFVFTGMLKMLNCWQEMAVILGHEMSHAIIGHSQEQQSYLAFGEVLTVPLLAFIWFFFDDFAAFLIYTIQSYIYPLVFEYGFSLPYSRLLESEADEVGLMLSSKACFDPRWSVLLWEKMALHEATIDSMDSDKFEYLSTHPGNQKRSISLEKLLPQMIELRKKCNCPDLPSDINPQAIAQKIRLCVSNVKERKELVAELQEQSSFLEQQTSSKAESSTSSGTDQAVEQKIKEKIVKIQLRLTELENEYATLTDSPKTESDEHAKKEKEGVLRRMWEEISGRINVSGNLNKTLYEKEKLSPSVQIAEFHPQK